MPFSDNNNKDHCTDKWQPGLENENKNQQLNLHKLHVEGDVQII